MIPVCLCLRAHQPRRLRAYNYFDVGRRHDYFDSEGAGRRLARDAESGYAPAVELLERLLDRHPRLSFALALSGPFREQLEEHAPSLLAGFRRLVATGRVEPLAATSQHGLRWIGSRPELEAQLALDRERIARHLGRTPTVFGGEEPPDPQELAPLLVSAGLSGMCIDGPGSLSSGLARGHVYRTDGAPGLPVLLAEDRLSSDVAAPSSDASLPGGRPTGESFDAWLDAGEGDVACLSLDLAAFGLPRSRQSDIFEFFEAWVERVLRRPDTLFLTPSEVFARVPSRESLPRATGTPVAPNEMQRDALAQLEALERRVRASGSPALLEDFHRLAASDHFDAMALRPLDAPGDAAAAESPYEVYMSFRHALRDLERRLPRPRPERPLSAGSPAA